MLNQFPVLRYDAGEKTLSGRPGGAAAVSEHPTGDIDMEVSGPGPVQGPLGPQNRQPAAQPRPIETPRVQPPQDEVDISPIGKKMEELGRTSQLRAERLARIRAAIEDGTYETPEKLERAVEALLADIRAQSAGEENT